jgi:hypothetical protein
MELLVTFPSRHPSSALSADPDAANLAETTAGIIDGHVLAAAVPASQPITQLGIMQFDLA